MLIKNMSRVEIASRAQKELIMLLYRETFASRLFDSIVDNYSKIIDGIKDDLNIEKSSRDISATFTFLDRPEDESISYMPVNEDGMFTEYMYFYYPSKSETCNPYIIFKLDIGGLVRLYMMNYEEFKKGVIDVNRFDSDF